MAIQVSVVVALFVVMGRASTVHRPPNLPPHLDPNSCPPTYEEHPLILVSMDGFRADYLTRGITPTLEALGKLGVRAPYMKPSFPTITFANHYTIATGLYPPSHGIIANKFYDPEFKEEFRPGRPESFQARFWGGEPIWKTVRGQGKKSATYFWPGSEVPDISANYWYGYNESVPFENRVDQVLEWLQLPPKDRPSLITLYMHEPDNSGHDFGTTSPEIMAALKHVDSMLKRLVEGLQSLNLLPCVNLLIVADHGMIDAGDERTIILDKYIPDLKARSRFWKGAFVRIQPNDEREKMPMMQALSCKNPVMRVYEKHTLPIRWHMGTQRRVEDIVVDVDPGYSVGGDDTFKADAGEHGYDNFFPSMNALFLAYGPDFRRDVEVEAFQNIELYNLMCHLVGVRPAPNNGTWGALHHMLAHPPPSPPNPKFEEIPRVAGLPLAGNIAEHMSYGNCEGDSVSPQPGAWIDALAKSQRNVLNLVSFHLPWGLPAPGQFGDSMLLLTQPDHLTAYSPFLKMPLWTSFTLTGIRRGSEPVQWRSDIRLEEHEMVSCDIYKQLETLNVTRQPLFPQIFSRIESLAQLPFLMSNAVPVSKQLLPYWEQLVWTLNQWTKMNGQINVVMGPVFDYDSDTFVDGLEALRKYQGFKVPTHLFMVVSRCLISVKYLNECPHTHVDNIAFVFPQQLAVPNCLSPAKYAREFMAKIQDVEKITGFRFFTNMRYDDWVRQSIRIHSNVWGRESWWNRLRTNFFGIGK